MNIINVSGDLPGFIARLTSFTSKLTSFDAEICAETKKSHNFQDIWAVSIGIAHF